jgi:hypothetical protein
MAFEAEVAEDRLMEAERRFRLIKFSRCAQGLSKPVRELEIKQEISSRKRNRI